MVLYIVSTPIGNLKDITLRALEVLLEVDLILCEDTRYSGQFLKHYGVNKPLLSLHQHNEINRIPEIIKKLKVGENIALISDSGTPLISDPGFKLVRTVRKEGFEVKTVPGPSTVTSAISISGLPSDKFLFVGYLPKTLGKRKVLLKELVEIKLILQMSLVFFESPFRIDKLLEELIIFFPDSQVSVQRELTKLHEEVINGTISEIFEKLHDKKHKGEFTLVLY